MKNTILGITSALLLVVGGFLGNIPLLAGAVVFAGISFLVIQLLSQKDEDRRREWMEYQFAEHIFKTAGKNIYLDRYYEDAMGKKINENHLDDLKRAVKIGPMDEAANVALAVIYALEVSNLQFAGKIRKKQHNAQLLPISQFIKKMEKKFPNSVGSLTACGIFYDSIYEHKKARKCLKKAYKISESDFIQLMLSCSYNQSGEHEKALEIHEKFGEKLGPFGTQYKMRTLYGLGKFTEAYKLSKKVRNMRNLSPIIMDSVVRSAFQSLHFFEASYLAITSGSILVFSEFEFGIKMIGGGVFSLILGSTIHFQQFLWFFVKKVPWLNKKMAGSFLGAHRMYLNLSTPWMKMDGKNWDYILFLMEKAYKLSPFVRNVVLNYGVSLLMNEKYDEAADMFRKGIEQFPKDQIFHDNLEACKKAMNSNEKIKFGLKVDQEY